MNSNSTERKEEQPPHSRIFVVISKHLREDDLRPAFESCGTIEDIHIPKDRSTGESKGVAYIKYEKTSSAAAAIKKFHMKPINDESKPMKVMLAINRNGGPTQNEKEDNYRRLFIKVHKDATENEIRTHFSSFGRVESVNFVRDKQTDICKGFAYVLFKTFYDAACAYESCDKQYKPMFATPREDLKRSRNSFDMLNYSSPRSSFSERYPKSRMDFNRSEIHTLGPQIQRHNTIVAKISPIVEQKYISQLFDLIPGMKEVQYSVDSYNGFATAIISYNEDKFATYAVEKLNKYEFPSGEIISVQPYTNPLAKAANDLTSIVNNFKNAVDAGNPDILQLADAIAQASSLIRAATSGNTEINKNVHDQTFCSVNLPPHKELANINSVVAQRLFIICKPHPPPIATLQNVFCRFGDLIDVSTFPNKTFGFVKYASTGAAQEALKTLNGAVVCGIRLKVLEADEKPSKNGDKKKHDDKTENVDYDIDTKRMRLEDSD